MDRQNQLLQLYGLLVSRLQRNIINSITLSHIKEMINACINFTKQQRVNIYELTALCIKLFYQRLIYQGFKRKENHRKSYKQVMIVFLFQQKYDSIQYAQFLDQQKKLLISNLSMQGNNKSKIQDLDNLLYQQSAKKLRNSLKNTVVSSLDLSTYRTTISNHCIIFQDQSPKSKINKKSNSQLYQQLTSIQDKLNRAKSQLSLIIRNGDKNKIKQNNNLKAQTNKTLLQEQNPRNRNIGNLKKSRIQDFTNIMPKPKNITPFLTNPYNSYKNNQYYISQTIRAVNEKNSLAIQHISTSIAILKHCAQVFENNSQVLADQQKIIIPRDPSAKKKKTLVLDLDQTLIHCFQNTECEPHLKLKTIIQDTQVDIQLVIRPYALTFLKRIHKKWQVIVFTASHQNYADVILDQIDPDNVMIQHRLYRQHCTHIGDMYIKNLSRLNRNLSEIVLVDNAAYSYALQLANGIPILPYYDGKDYELSALESYLQILEGCSDVRQINKNYFKLDKYVQFNESRQLIETIYIKNKEYTLL